MPLSTTVAANTPGTARRRAAFTLVELLVVMAIIAVLVSLILAGVQRVRVLGPQTENASRIQQIHDAIGRCKNDLKLDYIPSHALSGGGFTLKATYTGSEPELDILLRAFPNMNTAANPNPQNGDTTNGFIGTNVVLDANQTLCFFLTGGAATDRQGFSNDPRKPFKPSAGSGEQRKGPWLEPNNKLFGPGPNNHLWLIDVYGTPYAYFASVGGKQNNYGAQGFLPTTVPAQTHAVKPYTNGGRVMNESSFQIISAGRDKVFKPLPPTPVPSDTLPGTGSPGDEDNQSNFSKYLLGGRLD